MSMDAETAERILSRAPANVLDSRMTVTMTVGQIKRTYTGTVRALVSLGLVAGETPSVNVTNIIHRAAGTA